MSAPFDFKRNLQDGRNLARPQKGVKPGETSNPRKNKGPRFPTRGTRAAGHQFFFDLLLELFFEDEPEELLLF
jgi:hypothetical protein